MLNSFGCMRFIVTRFILHSNDTCLSYQKGSKTLKIKNYSLREMRHCGSCVTFKLWRQTVPQWKNWTILISRMPLLPVPNNNKRKTHGRNEVGSEHLFSEASFSHVGLHWPTSTQTQTFKSNSIWIIHPRRSRDRKWGQQKAIRARKIITNRRRNVERKWRKFFSDV